jgi:hypothetical protein
MSAPYTTKEKHIKTAEVIGAIGAVIVAAAALYITVENLRHHPEKSKQ